MRHLHFIGRTYSGGWKFRVDQGERRGFVLTVLAPDRAGAIAEAKLVATQRLG